MESSPSKSRKLNSPSVVVYHAPCPDGAFAALAAFLALSSHRPEPTFIPFTYSKPIDIASELKKLQNPTLYAIDCCPNDLVELCDLADRVILLDHHKTAIEKIRDLETANKIPKNLEHTLVLEKSGATIAYKYFTDVINNGTPLLADTKQRARIETVFEYIQDNDIWTHKLKDSKLFASGFGARKLDLHYPANSSLFDQLLNLDADQLIEEGKKVMEEEQKIINAEIETAFVIAPESSEGTKFGTMLAVYTKHPDFRSVQGNILAQISLDQKHRAIACVIVPDEEAEKQNKLKLSFRSLGKEDTTEICRAFGGGGHLNASSCLVDKSVVESWTTGPSAKVDL